MHEAVSFAVEQVQDMFDLSWEHMDDKAGDEMYGSKQVRVNTCGGIKLPLQEICLMRIGQLFFILILIGRTVQQLEACCMDSSCRVC